MRPWMAHIVNNTGAYNDFHNWCMNAVLELNKALAIAVRAGEAEKSRGIAHEIKVYEDIQKSVKREVREHNAQVTYINETKEG